jgi:hypothetical protein
LAKRDDVGTTKSTVVIAASIIAAVRLARYDI